ncbi:MAG: major facilitator superfamily 1 [Symbiobacteriaceae bacterium]|jgi:predicted MFS family arabinose efflux permease|nr:major facilitator superfamily 1 [Symbiobacteriaceae bacterium]
MSYVQDLYTDFIAFPRTVKLFYLTDIFFGFAQAIFSTLFNLHMLDAGFTADHIGQLQAVSSLVMAGLAIPVGLASDRWGRRWFYVVGSILFGIPYLVMPWLPTFPFMMAAWVVFSVGNTLMFVNESPLLAGEVGSDKRAAVFSFMMINFFVWNTLGIQLAGFLVDWMPHGALTKYQWPLVAAGVSAIMSGAVRAFLPFRPQGGAGPGARALSRRGPNLKPTRTTVMIGLISIFGGAYSALMFNFNNVILSQRFQFGTEFIATVLVVAGVVGWFGSVLVPWTSKRLGDFKGYVLCIGAQGIFLLLMGAATTPVLFLSVFWSRAVLGTMQMSLWNAFSMGVTPEAERATASSYAMLGRNLGSAVTAKVFGVMLAAGSYMGAFSLAGVLALGAAALTLLVFRREGRFAAGPEGA